MEIKILAVYELKGLLRVEVETPYGQENFGLGLNAKYLDPATDKPRWMSEIKRLLDNKYKNKETRKPVEVADAKKYIGKSMKLEDLETEPKTISEENISKIDKKIRTNNRK